MILRNIETLTTTMNNGLLLLVIIILLFAMSYIISEDTGNSPKH